jgi:hypothetical protein
MNIFWLVFNKWERFALAGLGLLIGFLYFGLWNKDRQINNLNDDINKSKVSYNLLLLQHKSLAYNVELQNTAIDKMKVDTLAANKKYTSDNKALEIKYNTLLTKYKNTNKCDTILKLNREFYNNDKGINYVE